MISTKFNPQRHSLDSVRWSEIIYAEPVQVYHICPSPSTEVYCTPVATLEPIGWRVSPPAIHKDTRQEVFGEPKIGCWWPKSIQEVVVWCYLIYIATIKSEWHGLGMLLGFTFFMWSKYSNIVSSRVGSRFLCLLLPCIRFICFFCCMVGCSVDDEPCCLFEESFPEHFRCTSWCRTWFQPLILFWFANCKLL